MVSRDRTTLYGALGIVFAFCCWSVGLIFTILCIVECEKTGRSPAIKYAAIGALALAIVVDTILYITGTLSFLMD